jgi:hypothetical protein
MLLTGRANARKHSLLFRKTGKSISVATATGEKTMAKTIKSLGKQVLSMDRSIKTVGKQVLSMDFCH